MKAPAAAVLSQRKSDASPKGMSSDYDRGPITGGGNAISKSLLLSAPRFSDSPTTELEGWKIRRAYEKELPKNGEYGWGYVKRQRMSETREELLELLDDRDDEEAVKEEYDALPKVDLQRQVRRLQNDLQSLETTNFVEWSVILIGYEVENIKTRKRYGDKCAFTVILQRDIDPNAKGTLSDLLDRPALPEEPVIDIDSSKNPVLERLRQQTLSAKKPKGLFMGPTGLSSDPANINPPPFNTNTSNGAGNKTPFQPSVHSKPAAQSTPPNLGRDPRLAQDRKLQSSNSQKPPPGSRDFQSGPLPESRSSGFQDAYSTWSSSGSTAKPARRSGPGHMDETFEYSDSSDSYSDDDCYPQTSGKYSSRREDSGRSHRRQSGHYHQSSRRGRSFSQSPDKVAVGAQKYAKQLLAATLNSQLAASLLNSGMPADPRQLAPHLYESQLRYPSFSTVEAQKRHLQTQLFALESVPRSPSDYSESSQSGPSHSNFSSEDGHGQNTQRPEPLTMLALHRNDKMDQQARQSRDYIQARQQADIMINAARDPRHERIGTYTVEDHPAFAPSYRPHYNLPAAGHELRRGSSRRSRRTDQPGRPTLHVDDAHALSESDPWVLPGTYLDSVPLTSRAQPSVPVMLPSLPYSPGGHLPADLGRFGRSYAPHSRSRRHSFYADGY